MMNDTSQHEPHTMQVIVRHTEVCERCGALNPFKKRSTDRGGDPNMWYARCKRCGASAKIFYD